jgi:hypothetical protein
MKESFVVIVIIYGAIGFIYCCLAEWAFNYDILVQTFNKHNKITYEKYNWGELFFGSVKLLILLPIYILLWPVIIFLCWKERH